MYFGAPAGLPAYCTGLGKTPPAYSNIGEFFLEVVDEYEAADNVKVQYGTAVVWQERQSISAQQQASNELP